MARTHLLSTLASAGLLAAALTSDASAQIAAEKVAGGFSSPVYVGSPPNQPDRLFVVEQNTARIKIIDNGTVLGTPFIDLNSVASSGGERGLLGLAFHPGYSVQNGPDEGRFFVHYTNNSGNTRLVEHNSGAWDSDTASTTIVQTIFSINQPFSNHNGGMIAFGPNDGHLYLGLGDGGSGNDPGNRAQNITISLGKILRFDVDIAAPFIPADNPYVGVAGNDEIWSIGQRNPWRFSFDTANGDMYIGDVGQNAREEISWQKGDLVNNPVALNFGWRCMEGFNCTGLSGCTCNSAALTLPIRDYSHGFGCSVTGGYVYRSAEIPGLQGTYFYGDYCSSRIWSLRYDGVNETEWMDRTAELEPPGNDTINSISSFGQDSDGNVYIVDHSGEVYKIIQDCSAENYCMTAPNSVGTGAVMQAPTGSFSISDNNFSLVVGGATPNEFGLFFFGGDEANFPMGDGNFCVAAGGIGLHRLLPPGQADLFGVATRQLDFTTSPGNVIQPGSTTYFSYWYRDPLGPLGTTFNFADGQKTFFCP